MAAFPSNLPHLIVVHERICLGSDNHHRGRFMRHAHHLGLQRIAMAGGAILAALASSGAAHAASSNSILKGAFPFNETIIAAIAPAGPGQTSCGSTLATPVQQQLTLTNQGTWTFDGKGGMLAQDTGVLTLLPGTSQYMDVSYSAASCPGTYQVSGNTVTMTYTCSLAGGALQFDVQSVGQITASSILVAIPPASGGVMRILPEYLVTNGQRTLLACAVVGENTHVALN
jgi:hypothetical protein